MPAWREIAAFPAAGLGAVLVGSFGAVDSPLTRSGEPGPITLVLRANVVGPATSLPKRNTLTLMALGLATAIGLPCRRRERRPVQ